MIHVTYFYSRPNPVFHLVWSWYWHARNAEIGSFAWNVSWEMSWLAYIYYLQYCFKFTAYPLPKCQMISVSVIPFIRFTSDSEREILKNICWEHNNRSRNQKYIKPLFIYWFRYLLNNFVFYRFLKLYYDYTIATLFRTFILSSFPLPCIL